MPMAPETNDNDLSQYEAIIERIEEIVRLLESGRSPLAESLKLYAEAKSLTEKANRLLERAESSLGLYPTELKTEEL